MLPLRALLQLNLNLLISLFLPSLNSHAVLFPLQSDYQKYKASVLSRIICILIILKSDHFI